MAAVGRYGFGQVSAGEYVQIFRGCSRAEWHYRERGQPGASDETTLIGQAPKEVQDAIKDWVAAGWTPMRRRVTPADVANVCALLCSDEASLLDNRG